MNMSVKISDLCFKNPVIAASGTFGFGREFKDHVDINKLGGICGKGLTRHPRKGNEPPRIAETPSGILNSVGLQNPGIERYISEELPFLSALDTVNIANIAGGSVEDYCYMADALSIEGVDAVEVNVSCPNVKSGCMSFGSDPAELRTLVREVRKYARKPLIIKLTPNVTDITLFARICEDEGADSVSLINTVLGLAVDIETRRPVLKNNYGGLSGPCIKPIALRMVSQVYMSVRIPIIGMGGIMTHTDIIEFMMAGATACMIGTANFVEPDITSSMIRGLGSYMADEGIDDINSIIGSLKLY